MKCMHCGDVIEHACANHVRWCAQNPRRQEYIEKLAMARLARKRLGRNQFVKAKEEGREVIVSDETRLKISATSRGRRHSDDVKVKMSVARKEYLDAHPDAHVWKRSSKFVSAPCQHLKSLLNACGLTYVEEYSPIPGRFFSVDIAFLDCHLAVEVNGEQHYNRDRSLKTYYQMRHDLIESHGWLVLELHYATVYKHDIVDFIKEAIASRAGCTAESSKLSGSCSTQE